MIFPTFRTKRANRTSPATETTQPSQTSPTTWTPQDESDIPDNLRIQPTYVDPWANDPDRTTRRETYI